MLKSNTEIHFIGIGGIGMSGLALILLSRGYIITGSDTTPNNLTEKIVSKGGKIYTDHKRENISNAGLVVYSSSISADNPELKEAKKKGIRILHRGELLAELMKEKEGVAITGSHGKTTTTSMICDILINAQHDPVCILGGESYTLNGNVRAGKGNFLVAEADESDGSHLFLRPRYGIITNVDREHLDYYKDTEGVTRSSRAFMQNIEPNGMLFALIDDPILRKLLLHYDHKFATFGLSKEADLYAEGIVAEGMKTRFDCIYHKERIGTIHLNVPGTHNILNSLAAILFALHIGIDFEAIARTLYEFKSAKRRFEVYPDTGNMTLLEDYAHHPTEIKATLKACRLLKPERIITVFQPHRYTRTKELAKEFGASFNLCDKLILTNIYAASQRPIDGVSVKNILDEVRKTGFKDVHIIPKKNITDYLYDTYQDGDLVAILGAGDINDVGRELKERLSNDKTS